MHTYIHTYVHTHTHAHRISADAPSGLLTIPGAKLPPEWQQLSRRQRIPETSHWRWQELAQPCRDPKAEWPRRPPPPPPSRWPRASGRHAGASRVEQWRSLEAAVSNTRLLSFIPVRGTAWDRSRSGQVAGLFWRGSSGQSGILSPSDRGCEGLLAVGGGCVFFLTTL